MKEILYDFLARISSRKFLLAVAASLTAYGIASADNVITVPEMWTILTPVLAFLGVEGAADAASRLKEPELIDAEADLKTASSKK